MSDKRYNGEKYFEEGLLQSFNAGVSAIKDESSDSQQKAAIDLFQKAINEGLCVYDEWFAYLTMSHDYLRLGRDNEGLSSFRNAHALMNRISAKGFKSNEDKQFWEDTQHELGLLLCLKARERKNEGDYLGQKGILEEAVLLTDHPLAHNDLAVLYDGFSNTGTFGDENENLRKAIFHLDYIINNEDKLEHFPTYQEERDHAIENRVILEKIQHKDTSLPKNKGAVSQDFIFTRDFKLIDWKSTIQVNLIRGFFAGIIWSLFMFFIAQMGVAAFVYVLIWPLFAWIVIFPFMKIVTWLSELGVPFIGFMAPILAFMMAVGDPFTYILHKNRPDFVPVDEYKFFNLNPIIFVVDDIENSISLND